MIQTLRFGMVWGRPAVLKIFAILPLSILILRMVFRGQNYRFLYTLVSILKLRKLSIYALKCSFWGQTRLKHTSNYEVALFKAL